MKLLDTLYDSLRKSAGSITIEEFHDTVLGLDTGKEDSYNLVASIIAMDGRFCFEGESIVLRPEKGTLSGKSRERAESDGALRRLTVERPAIPGYEPDKLRESHILDASYSVLDFETTGISANLHKVIEIGVVRIEKAKICDCFRTFVDPKSYIPSFITGITGITQEMVKGAPEADSAFSGLYGFLKDSILVAHNISFDERFLKRNFESLGLPVSPVRFCTMKLARRFLKGEIANARLETVATHFGIATAGHHRALDDAKMTAQIFLHFLEMAEKWGLETISRFLEFQALPPSSL